VVGNSGVHVSRSATTTIEQLGFLGENDRDYTYETYYRYVYILSKVTNSRLLLFSEKDILFARSNGLGKRVLLSFAVRQAIIVNSAFSQEWI